MADKTKKLIADTFLAIAEGLETGTFGAKPKIAVTAMGSEHGEETVMEGAVKAARAGADVYFIGTITHPEVTTVAVADEGVELRRAGITAGILIMNPEMSTLSTLFEYHLEPEV